MNFLHHRRGWEHWRSSASLGRDALWKARREAQRQLHRSWRNRRRWDDWNLRWVQIHWVPKGAKKGKKIDKRWWGTTSGISLGAFNVVQLIPCPHWPAFQVIDAGAELRKANTQAMLKCQCLGVWSLVQMWLTSTFHYWLSQFYEAPDFELKHRWFLK